MYKLGVEACSIPLLQRRQMCAKMDAFHNSMNNKAIRTPLNISLSCCDSDKIISSLNIKFNSNS